MGFLEVASLVMSILASGYQAVVAEFGAAVDAKALSLARDIAAKISKNNNLKDQLFTAYQNKNSEILNSMFRGMGFGPRADALAKERESTDRQYKIQTKKLSDENVELERQANIANQASLLGGSSITGNIKGSKVLDSLFQNIKGGAH